MVNKDFLKNKNIETIFLQIKMLPILTNHSMKYFFTNDTGESTKLLLTSQISDIAATKYPIAILYKYKKHDSNKKSKFQTLHE